MRVQSKSKQGLYALGRLKSGELNKTEKAYEDMLKGMIVAGELLWYRFEGLKLRLADNTFYTPDFFLMTSEGQFEAHEVKGYWQDDARVKIKVAAEMYPFRFVAAKPKEEALYVETLEKLSYRKKSETSLMFMTISFMLALSSVTFYTFACSGLF